MAEPEFLEKPSTVGLITAALMGCPEQSEVYISQEDGSLKKVQAIAITRGDKPGIPDRSIVITTHDEFETVNKKQPIQKIFSNVYQREF